MATPQVPQVLWIGRTENEWPIHAWDSEAAARSWLEGPSGSTLGNKRHIWQVRVVEPIEFHLVYTEPRLEPVK